MLGGIQISPVKKTGFFYNVSLENLCGDFTFLIRFGKAII